MGTFSDRDAARVLASIADDGPAVVDPGSHHVELVAAPRPMLVSEENARRRMECETLHVPVPGGEDLGPRPGHFDEGIVARHAAVVPEPDDAPRMNHPGPVRGADRLGLRGRRTGARPGRTGVGIRSGARRTTWGARGTAPPRQPACLREVVLARLRYRRGRVRRPHSSDTPTGSAQSRGEGPRRATRPGPLARTGGTPATGLGSRRPAVTVRSRPGRSVTSIRPSGRKASPPRMIEPFRYRDHPERVLFGLDCVSPRGGGRQGEAAGNHDREKDGPAATHCGCQRRAHVAEAHRNRSPVTRRRERIARVRRCAPPQSISLLSSRPQVARRIGTIGSARTRARPS